MEIRLGIPGDMPRLLELSKVFWDESLFHDLAPFDPVSAEILISSCMDMRLLVVIEHEGVIIGMTGGYLMNWVFNTALLQGQEIFRYVPKEYRHLGVGDMLRDALEGQARAMNCDIWHIADQAEIDKDGYNFKENLYVKVL